MLCLADCNLIGTTDKLQISHTYLCVALPGLIRLSKALVNVGNDSVHGRLLDGCTSKVEIVHNKLLNGSIGDVLLEDRQFNGHCEGEKN